MVMQTKKGYLRGVRGILLTELDHDGTLGVEKHWIDTAQEAAVEAQYEDGESDSLRGGDRILATVEEDDIMTGVEVTVTDARFDARATVLMGGGSLIEVDNEIVGWKAPMLADQGNKKPFMLEIFVQNFNASGMKDQFLKVTVPYCKGKLPNLSYGDQEWASEEFVIKGKENGKLNMPTVMKEFVPTLPAQAPVN